MDDLISREQALDAIHDWKPSDVFDEFNPTTAFTIIYALPSAQVDLSGFCDRLWRSAYDRGYAWCKDDAVEAIEMLFEQSEDDEHDKTWNDAIRGSINAVKHHTKTAQPDISEDGTLMITVPQGMLEKVKRVMVDEVGTKNCKVMYQDEPERKNGEWIPVSERLPEVYENAFHETRSALVLVTIDDGLQIGYTTDACLIDGVWQWCIEDDYWGKVDGEVIAWQPFPEPYKGEEEW